MNIGNAMLNIGNAMLNIGNAMLNIGNAMLNIGNAMLNIGNATKKIKMQPAIQINILKQTYPYLNDLEITALLRIGTYQHCQNRTKIITKGEKTKTIFFILSGMVRGYFMNEKGEEKNIFLRPEYTLTGAPDTLFSNLATKYTFEAILETHILKFDFNEFQNLSQSHPNLTQIYIDALQENVQTLILRVESLIDKSPEERYDALLQQNPHFFQTAFNKHIANYLGITAVSLSRIIRRKSKG
jgi:CRP-like cAMP-binding protein